MSTQLAGSRAEAQAIFRTHLAYLSGPTAAESLWRKLTPVDRQRLGESLVVALDRHGKPVEIWKFLNNVSTGRAVVELAVKLFSFPADEADWLLREMGELPLTAEAAQGEAIRRGDLVLIRRTHTVFWGGEDLEVQWGRGHVPWNFLVLACEHAREGRDIDCTSFGDNAFDGIVADRICRLRKVPGIPQELVDYFIVVGPRTQRFIYPADEIHLFDE